MKQKHLDGQDVTELLSVCIHPSVFYPLQYRPLAKVAILFVALPDDSRLVASFNATLSLSNLEVYNVCLADYKGLVAGYLFISPLSIRVDMGHVLFFRSTVKPRDLITSMSLLPKRLLSRDIVFHGNDSMHYLVLRKSKHPLLTFIAGDTE